MALLLFCHCENGPPSPPIFILFILRNPRRRIIEFSRADGLALPLFFFFFFSSPFKSSWCYSKRVARGGFLFLLVFCDVAIDL